MADRKLDEYKHVNFYKENTNQKDFGFSKFEVDGEFYFCRYLDGNIALLSQAYSGKVGRDNGIESVKKNEKIESRYRFDTRKGDLHGFGLFARNGQEIAISPDFKTAAQAERLSGRLTGKVKAASKTNNAKTKKVASKGAAFSSRDGRIENYKPLNFYVANGGKENGFNSFEKEGAFYFNYADNDEVVLISESYTSRQGRDNGITSVTKNMSRAAAYQHHVHKNGKHYFDINAKNGQEIATSRWYSSKKASLRGAGILRGEVVSPAKLAPSRRSASEEENYQPVAFYRRHTKGKKKGFEKFHGDDGEYYFAYFENNKLALISEGYPTAAIRDKGVASVEKNIKLEKRYIYGKGAEGKPGFILRAGNHKEIARSVGYGSAAAAATAAAYLIGKRRRVAVKKTAAAVTAAAALGTPVKAKPVKKASLKPTPASKPKLAGAAKIAVVGLGASAVKAAATPNEVDKKAIPVKAGPLVAAAPIVSTAAPIAAAAAVAAVAPKPAAPEVKPVVAAPVATAAAAPVADVAGGGIWKWLKWLLLALLALLALLLWKSCSGEKTKAATAPPIVSEAPAPAALVACWNGTKAKSEGACPAKVTCWDKSFAISEAACPVKPIVKDFKCWDGTMAVDEFDCAPQPEKPTPAPKTPAATTITSAAPVISIANKAATTPSSVKGRLCGYSPNVLFNVGSVESVRVTRLGTNPEFGNSQSLTPEGFYRKLQAAYDSNSNDRSFLNLLARSLGYGSFADMDATMFSNDTLADGTSGLLGFGSQHALQFSTFDMTDPEHLNAFKLRSANGMDVHFMKRCGNFMYVCEP